MMLYAAAAVGIVIVLLMGALKISSVMSDRAALMHLALRRKIRLVRFFGGGEDAEMKHSPSPLDVSAIRLALGRRPVYAKEPGGIAAGRLPLVLLVYRWGNVAQICNCIVQRVAVYVVDLMLGPLTVDIKPRKAVGKVMGVVNANLGSPFQVDRAGYLAYASACPGDRFPGEYASRWIVVQQFAKTFGREGRMFTSHAISPVGRVVRRLTSLARCGPSLIIAPESAKCCM